jgi:hypothetical protein
MAQFSVCDACGCVLVGNPEGTATLGYFRIAVNQPQFRNLLAPRLGVQQAGHGELQAFGEESSAIYQYPLNNR